MRKIQSKAKNVSRPMESFPKEYKEKIIRSSNVSPWLDVNPPIVYDSDLFSIDEELSEASIDNKLIKITEPGNVDDDARASKAREMREVMLEVSVLKQIVLEVANIMDRQSENLNLTTENGLAVRERVDELMIELEKVHQDMHASNRVKTIKSSIYTLIGLLGIHLPIAIFFGIKTGLFTFSSSWMLWAIKSLF